MPNEAIALMAHLMRRAGFGAPYAELEARAAKGYEATVEELLQPEVQPELDYDIMLRYKTEWVNKNALEGQQEEWVFRMINSKRPLEEKLALFWHGLLCTGHAKCENPRQQNLQLDMFRRLGMGSFLDLLMELAVDPAMVFYLDNCMSHKGAINENWGRELLELFSMGVGMDGKLNYGEDDVKEAARAFTGWTVANAMPRYPYGRYLSKFIYDPKDHDDGVKTFLGETGNWNGEDIINIIAKQPATARFVSRHLYNYFVADEPQVPAWQHTPPRDPEAIRMLEAEYFRSNYDIRSMLRLLFNADFFKNARFAKVKSPAETVVGTTRLVGDFAFPRPGFNAFGYPRKVGRKKAEELWSRLAPSDTCGGYPCFFFAAMDSEAARMLYGLQPSAMQKRCKITCCVYEELAQRIIAAVEAHRHTPQWTKDGGQFIPHATTFLNQERWSDVVAVEEVVPSFKSFKPV